MTRDELSRNIKMVVAIQLELNPFDVSEDNDLVELGANSLSVVLIQAACEERLGITAPFDSLPGPKVGDYVNYYAEVVGAE